MRTRLVVVVALLACAAPRARTPSGEEVFSIAGRVEGGTSRFGLDDLPRLPRRSFDAVPPQTGARARFEGVALATVLAEVVEPARDADLAVVHGKGGLVVAVPLVSIRGLKPVLADRVDGAPAAGWRADAAPLVLAWPNLDNPGLDTDPRLRWWWVPGVTKVELASWAATYGRALRVPPGATDEARLGAEVLSASCLGCHRVRNVGGTRGPALDASRLASDGPALAGRLREHLRRTSGFETAPEVAPAQAANVAAFLRAVELAGPQREDEVKEPVTPPAARPGGPPRGY
jgi:mono/diheme cytochrome c family protein